MRGLRDKVAIVTASSDGSVFFRHVTWIHQLMVALSVCVVLCV